jgi:HEPN domain-containing protein
MNKERTELEQQIFKWIEIAEEDLILAKHAFTIEYNVPYRLIGYHAQQCAEKYLKAFLVSKMIDFPYTHSIDALVNFCPTELDLHTVLADTFELTNYAVARRYPGFYINLSKEDAEQAVMLAEKVKKVVGDLLKESGVDPENFVK